jgi:hypothetical protein
MQRLTKFLSVALLSTYGSTVFAHEGHGHGQVSGNSPTHYFTEPMHLMQFAAIALAVLAIGWFAMKLFSKKSVETKLN